jgi:integrative and conjugative element protein (TIGR02256 family)
MADALEGALTFVNAKGDKLKLSEEVVAQMRVYTQRGRAAREAGGILLGRYLIGCQDAIVDQITVPTDRDKRSHFSFFRSVRGHQAAVVRLWTASKGTCHYLGEWHSHPESDPVPSKLDMLNWKRLLGHHRTDADPLYFVIVGMETISVWQGHEESFVIEKLELQNIGER